MGFQRTFKSIAVCDKSHIWWQFVHAAGPETKKALSPKTVLVLGTSKEPDVEDLRVTRRCIDDIET